jgi:signal transduction histidine kinase
MPAAAGSPIVHGMDLWRWIRRVPARGWVADGLLALAVLLVNFSAAFLSGVVEVNVESWRSTDALGYLLLSVGPLALVFRRRWPLPVLAVTLAASTLYSARHYPEGGTGLAIFVALYTVAVVEERRRLVVAAAAAVALMAASSELVFYRATMFDGEPLYGAVLLLSAWWLGEAVRNRRAYVAELRDRAEQAERTREEEARRRVDEERLRIARELHDVVSHSIGVISVQAGVAAHLLRRRPDKAAQSLEAIRHASDEALGELHTMLGVLRQPDDGRPPLAPAPGLAQLDALVAQAEAAGLKVEVAVEGEPRALPHAVDLACYRIVQESLTNVVRHAGASRATVTVDHHDGEVVIEVRDDGLGAPAAVPAAGAGQGINGMRERARALGGTLEAGPCPDGGFLVRARLPEGGLAA